MFYLNKNKPLTIELLQKMLNRFHVEVEPKLQRYKNYYDGIQAILQKSYADASKPCNKVIINYTKIITDAYTGYLATPGYISYSSQNDIEEIMNILRYNDYQSEDAHFLQDALVYGVAHELMYIDNGGQTRFRLINPLNCFGVYDDSLTGDLMYFVRVYKESDWDETDTYLVDVYSDFDIKHYSMNGWNGNVSFIGEEPHFFGQCPANIFTLPDEKSIFDCVMSLQDAINTLISSEVDDYEAFCDAYMTLEGVDADADDIAAMKQNRVMLLPLGAKAGYLTKAAQDAQIENMLKRIQDGIFKTAQCPDFSAENFVGGVSSGIAIQYRLCGMENKAGAIEGEMKKALQRRIEIICGIASLKLGEEVFRDIKIDFKRNIPEDVAATVDMIGKLKGSVSDATLLSQLPFVEDVEAELEALQKQKEASMSLYSFTPVEDDEE